MILVAKAMVMKGCNFNLEEKKGVIKGEPLFNSRVDFKDFVCNTMRI